MVSHDDVQHALDYERAHQQELRAKFAEARANLVRPGSQFYFRKLDGVLDNERVMTIFDISVGGSVTYRLDHTELREPSLNSLFLRDLQYLIDAGVWVPVRGVTLDGIDEIRRMLLTDKFTSPAHLKSMGFGEEIET